MNSHAAQDKPSAQELADLRARADAGEASAQFNLGLMYTEGRGVPQDDAEAIAWYRRSAEQGHAGAQVNLGGMYANGRGVPQDYVEAIAWYRRAAEQGDAVAQLRRPQFSWTRIRGESDVKGGGGYGWVEASAGSGVGADGGSPEGDRSRRRRRGGWVGRLGARAAVEREPETGRGSAAAARRVA